MENNQVAEEQSTSKELATSETQPSVVHQETDATIIKKRKGGVNRKYALKLRGLTEDLGEDLFSFCQDCPDDTKEPLLHTWKNVFNHPHMKLAQLAIDSLFSNQELEVPCYSSGIRPEPPQPPQPQQPTHPSQPPNPPKSPQPQKSPQLPRNIRRMFKTEIIKQVADSLVADIIQMIELLPLQSKVMIHEHLNQILAKQDIN